MRAALLLAANEPLVVTDDVELAPPQAGEVLVKVHHCGLCHSDVHFMDGSLPLKSPREKKLIGCCLGSSNPHFEFGRLLSLYYAGKLDLDAMITARRPLEEINDAVEDLKAGVGLRTILDL